VFDSIETHLGRAAHRGAADGPSARSQPLKKITNAKEKLI
jgi:hypothetical protein